MHTNEEAVRYWYEAAVERREERDELRATVARVRRLHDALDSEDALSSPDDEITKGAAAKKIAAALDGWSPEPTGTVPVVAYRHPDLDVLYCVECRPGFKGKVPMESDDLPHGGICDNCDRDVFVVAQAKPSQPHLSLAALAGDLRYVLNYRGPEHDHERLGIWDASGEPCQHCARLEAARRNLAAYDAGQTAAAARAERRERITETLTAIDRTALSEKLWRIAEHHIIAEWICCEPLEPRHHLCAKGYAALGMTKTLLVDSAPEEAWNPAAPVLDAVIAELEQLRRERDLAIAHDRQSYPTAWAYEQACKALRRKTDVLDRVREYLERHEHRVAVSPLDVLALLDEAQQQEPESGCAHCGGDHSWDDCRAYTTLVRDDGAQQRESTVRPPCQHCGLPHDLTPSMELACASIRARIRDHHGDDRADVQTPEQVARDHVTTLHLMGERLAEVESWMWQHLADLRDAGRPAASTPQDGVTS